MKVLVQYAAVAGAGAIGAVARLGVATVCNRLFRGPFPVGTLVINVTGSLFLGWFLTAVGTRFAVSETVRLAVAVGFVGAYTTFSTYMYESSVLMQDGSGMRAMLYLLGSVVLGLLAVRVGVWIARV